MSKQLRIELAAAFYHLMREEKKANVKEPLVFAAAERAMRGTYSEIYQ